jgi:hypothetical protein
MVVRTVHHNVRPIFLIELTPFARKVRFDVGPVAYNPSSIGLWRNDHFIHYSAGDAEEDERMRYFGVRRVFEKWAKWCRICKLREYWRIHDSELQAQR